MDRLGPGFGAGKPGLRWWIGRATQKHDDQQIVNRLGVGQVRMHPQPVSRLQIRHFSNGYGYPRTPHMDLKFRANQIKSRIVGVSECRE